MISLPCVRETDAAIENFTFLHMGSKGMFDVRGSGDKPLIASFLIIGGKDMPLSNLTWTRSEHWIPHFTGEAENFKINGTILTPVDERGFGIKLEIKNIGGTSAEAGVGLKLCWGSVFHSVNEDKFVDAPKHAYESFWNRGYIFDMRCGTPLFAFAPMTVEEDAQIILLSGGKGRASNDVFCNITREKVVEPGETLTLTTFWGIGFEEVAAATSAQEMLRQGWDFEMNATISWLKERIYNLPDPKLTKLYNENLFFCLFYASGITVDTEELALMTSRSPRYYVSAAYWDRDSLLWAFPAVLDADTELAREMLLYVFGRQCRNIGIHSRFIDGTVLEPGFELDELMAPVIALNKYVEKTGDKSILERTDVSEGIASILRKLAKRKHEKISLFSTFLQPTDDMNVYPYLTYDNALVWYSLSAIDELYPGRFECPASPKDVMEAIWTHCVKEIDGEKRFAWSLDLENNFDVYDEPPGSLLLLPYYGFCELDNPIYVATSALIRSEKYKYSFAESPIAEIGCAHAPHPWVLSIANSLLCGHKESALKHLSLIEMDNGIACESVDESTGECTTGAAFATCAGFLCHALRVTCGE